MEILGWLGFFLISWGLPFTVYLALQVYLLVTLKGKYRLLASIPVIPMSIVMSMTVSAYRQHSNLWPILLILVSPVGIIALSIIRSSSNQPQPPNP